MNNTLENKKLDQGWVELFLHALELGLSPNEIRTFFNESNRPE